MKEKILFSVWNTPILRHVRYLTCWVDIKPEAPRWRSGLKTDLQNTGKWIYVNESIKYLEGKGNSWQNPDKCQQLSERRTLNNH
jgi:hypothetical protein